MKVSRSILLVLCVAGFSGCDILYGVLHKEGAEEKKLVGDVVPYQANPTVEEIQELLKLYGYNPGRIDGVMGVQTRNAIAAFQEDRELEVSRFVDEATWEKLSLFEREQFVVNGELNVVFIQEVLRALGFNPGKIDGKWGKKTERAVKNFQKSRGLKADGKVGYRTLSRLLRETSSGEQGTNPAP